MSCKLAFVVIKKIFWQIWGQKSASGAMERSVSHFSEGMEGDVSACDNNLYILDKSFLGEEMLMNVETVGGRSKFIFLFFIVDWMDDETCRYCRN